MGELYPEYSEEEHTITIETLAELVHKAYCKEYERQKGEPYWTEGDYSKLDDNVKEYDRVTVRAVINEVFPSLTDEQPCAIPPYEP